MKFMSTDLHLDTQYTNHSIRATVISTLDRDGFEARHIMKLSSHKSEATIKEYSVDCPDNKRKEMFDSLSNALVKKTCTVSKPSDTDSQQSNEPTISDVVQNLPNFALQPLDMYDTIDDSILANLIYDSPNNEGTDKNKQETEKKSETALQVVPQNVNVPALPNATNTQVNVKNQKFPILPQMYFPHSNVTINYNFGNQ